MYLFNEKTLNRLFTFIFLILIIYLILVFVGDIVDRRISNIQIRLPSKNDSYEQTGGLILEAGPVGRVAEVLPATAAVPVTNETYTVFPSAIPLPEINYAVSTPALAAPVAIPTQQLNNTIPLANLPPAVAASAITVENKLTDTTKIVPINNPNTTSTTYYKSPLNMTPEQRRKFKEQADFAKMTLDDYRNWLGLWANDTPTFIKLFPAHIVNFNKYITGQPLIQKDLEVITSIIMPVAVKTPGLDTSQNLYNRFFLGDQYSGAYPEVFSTYPSVTTVPLQIATTLPTFIS